MKVSSSNRPLPVAANAVRGAVPAPLFPGVDMDDERYNLAPTDTGYRLALLWAVIGVVGGLLAVAYAAVKWAFL